MLDGDYQEGAGGDEFVCGLNTIFYRPPRIKHWSAKGKKGARVLHLEVSNEWQSAVEKFSPLPTRPSLLCSGHIAAFASAIRRHWCSNNPSAPLAIEGLLYEIVAQICSSQQTSRGARPKCLDRVTEILRERFHQPVHLPEIADEVGYHPVYLTRIFRQYYGKTMNAYVRQLRIDFARRQLVRDDLSLVEVGLSAGFPSHAYFSTVFKQETGMTPMEYRRAKEHTGHAQYFN